MLRPDKLGLAMTNYVSELAGGLVLGAETSGADVDFCGLPFYHNRSAVDIGIPTSGNMPFRMADTTSELYFLTTDFALHESSPAI